MSIGGPRKSGLQPDGSRWIWPFQLTDRLGEGGMGVVYRGLYIPKKIEVAVKMLPEDVADPVVLARFQRELDVLKKLRHPNIVRCFGGVTENDANFYAMELIGGGTLEDVLDQRGSLPWEQVVEYGRQMAAALVGAHAAGVAHRDLKPANFLISNEGTLKLADFGLAFIDAKRRITRAGKTAGTVLYMSPEQIRGQEVGPASDLYSLGCVLYEMLAGHPPFEGDSQAAILHAHVSKPPSRLSAAVLDCPPELDRLVHQLLAKEIDERPSSAAAVIGALKQIRPNVVVAAKRDVVSTKGSNQPLAAKTSSSKKIDSASPTKAIAKLPPIASGPAWLRPALVATAAIGLGLAFWSWSAASTLAPWRANLLAAAAADGPEQPRLLRLIGPLAGGDDEAIAVLRTALGSGKPEVRAAAAEAAGASGSGDMDLVGQLRQLAKEDADDRVRSAASQAMQRLGSSGQ